MKRILFFFSIFFFSLNSYAIDLGGIKLNQNIDDYLIISEKEKNREIRIRKFDKEVRIFLNNSFNLSNKNKSTYKDFDIPFPDYFWDRYYIYEKDNKNVYINAYKQLNKPIIQSKFKTGECASLRKQFIKEEIGSKLSKKKIQYLRWTSRDYIKFKDRVIHTIEEDGVIYNYLFSCIYSIFYEDNEHYISNSFIVGINNNNQITNNIDNYLNAKELKAFNESLIKNFKIWGNYEISENYELNDKFYSLYTYRKKSTDLHFAELNRKEQERLEAEKKAIEERKRKEQEKLEAAKKAIEERKRKEQEKLEAEKKAIVMSEITLKARIYSCWSIPIGLPYEKDLKVRIKLKLNENGYVLSTKIIDYERMSDPIYKLVAESALRAIERCEPLNTLKSQEVTLNFAPKDMF